MQTSKSTIIAISKSLYMCLDTYFCFANRWYSVGDIAWQFSLFLYMTIGLGWLIIFGKANSQPIENTLHMQRLSLANTLLVHG